jgi:cytochrome c-type biogenesis protein CcmI
MTRLQRLTCLALAVLAAVAITAAILVHDRAERGRAALARADRAHLAWFDARIEELEARARLGDLATRHAKLRADTALAHRRLIAAIDQARRARRPVLHAPPRVVHRVRTVLVPAVPR